MLLAATPLAAADALDPGDPIDLSAAVRHAVTAGPHVESARLRYEALLELPAAERGLPDPMLSYAFMFSDIVTANGPIERTVELMQDVPTGGQRRLRAGVSDAQARVAGASWAEARLDVAERVREAYYRLFIVDRSTELVHQEAEVIDDLERTARARYRSGGGAQAEVLRIQTERQRIDERLLMLRAERDAAAAELNAALGRDAAAFVGRAVDPPPDVALPDDASLYERARAGRPEIEQSLRMADTAEAQGRLARRGFYPDLRVGLQWSQIGDTQNPFAPEPGQDAYMVNLGVTLPVWRAKRKAELRAAEAMAGAARGEALERTSDAQAEVRVALAAVRTRADLARLYESTLIPQAEATLAAGGSAYRNGAMDFLGVLDAERSLLALRLAHATTLGELGIGLARLDRAVGGGLLDVEPAPESEGEATP